MCYSFGMVWKFTSYTICSILSVILPKEHLWNESHSFYDNKGPSILWGLSFIGSPSLSSCLHHDWKCILLSVAEEAYSEDAGIFSCMFCLQEFIHTHFQACAFMPVLVYFVHCLEWLCMFTVNSFDVWRFWYKETQWNRWC